MHMSENILPVLNFASLSSKTIDRKKCSLVPRPPLVHMNRLSSPGNGYVILLNKSQKFSEGKQVRVGMEASKTNQTRWE